MFKSMLAVLALSISVPALAQTAPTPSTKAPTMLVYPDGSVATFSDDIESRFEAEKAFRATVTSSSVNDSFSQTRHQCRAWMTKDRIAALDLKWLKHERLMLTMITSLNDLPAAYGRPDYAIDQSNRKHLSEINATLNCAKVLGLPKATVTKTEG